MPSSHTAPTPRLHVVWRAGAPCAVILLKRGKHFCTLSWELGSGRIELGQWCKNKIYLRRCDLTHDGRYWGYFALNGRWESESKGAYGVIARPPWLKALFLFPLGSTWGGGVEFHTRYGFELHGSEGGVYRFGQWPLYRDILVRNGWELRDERVLTKSLTGSWTLVKTLPDTENMAESHRLEAKDGAAIELTDWEWAEVLDDGRLVWASGAVLRAVPLPPSGPWLAERGQPSVLDGAKVLLDARELTFERRRAPYVGKTVIVEDGWDGPYVVGER